MTDVELAIYIGEKIKEYRKLKGLTQKELAKKIGMGDTTIANYKKVSELPKRIPYSNWLKHLTYLLMIYFHQFKQLILFRYL